MKDEPFAVIDTHIKCANSLVSGEPDDFRLSDFEKSNFPDQYRNLKGFQKELDQLETKRNDDRKLLTSAEIQELYRNIRHALFAIEELKQPIIRGFSEALKNDWECLADAVPFNWRIEFGEIFDEQRRFDIVVVKPQ